MGTNVHYKTRTPESQVGMMLTKREFSAENEGTRKIHEAQWLLAATGFRADSLAKSSAVLILT
jgi:hypothetical protein